MKLLEKVKSLLLETLPPPRIENGWERDFNKEMKLTFKEVFCMWWCYYNHKKISRPIEGKYTCFECGREWEAPFK